MWVDQGTMVQGDRLLLCPVPSEQIKIWQKSVCPIKTLVQNVQNDVTKIKY